MAGKGICAGLNQQRSKEYVLYFPLYSVNKGVSPIQETKLKLIAFKEVWAGQELAALDKPLINSVD